MRANATALWKSAARVAAFGPAVLLSAGQAHGGILFATGFESADNPSYTIGELGGQNDWFVAPLNANGMVQGAFVAGGSQAVEIVDGASFGRAQVNISSAEIGPVLVSSFAMYAGAAWAAIPGEVQDRFEAQQRLEFADSAGAAWGLEVGFITTSIDYGALTAGQSALYIELTSDDIVQASSFAVVDASSVLDAWHSYEVSIDIATGAVGLWFDGEAALSLNGPVDLASISVLQLQNQRWGTNPNENASLYFDDLRVASVPGPASVCLLLGGVLTLIPGRRGSRAPM